MIDSFMGEYRFLSNFHLSLIKYKNIVYPSTEHAYQAMKSPCKRIRKIFSKLEKCSESQHLGQHIRMREDWEEIKLDIMEDVVRLKFKDPILKQLLLDTGHQPLIEGNHWGDIFWGVFDGKGENHLGKILMNIREELR